MKTMLNHSVCCARTVNKEALRVAGVISPFRLMALLLLVWCWTPAFSSQTVEATGAIEVAFSPDQGAEALAIKVIDSARYEVKVLAYSFTSAPIVRALLSARKRGAAVSLVVDEKANFGDSAAGRKAKSALDALVYAGCSVYTATAWPIHHDKQITVDGKHTLTGSFNFSNAANYNSENVLVNWNNPQLAQVYLSHFSRNARASRVYSLNN